MRPVTPRVMVATIRLYATRGKRKNAHKSHKLASKLSMSCPVSAVMLMTTVDGSEMMVSAKEMVNKSWEMAIFVYVIVEGWSDGDLTSNGEFRVI